MQGCGKAVAADMLREEGFQIIELGDIWRELLVKAKIPKEDMKAGREFTLQLRLREGKDVYARYALERIDPSMKKVVIMGVRSTYEIDHLKKNAKDKIVVVALTAPLSLRFERMRARNKPEDPKTVEDFRWLEARNRRGFMADKGEEKFGLATVMKQADYRVSNTGTLEALRDKLSRVIKKISKVSE